MKLCPTLKASCARKERPFWFCDDLLLTVISIFCSSSSGFFVVSEYPKRCKVCTSCFLRFLIRFGPIFFLLQLSSAFLFPQFLSTLVSATSLFLSPNSPQLLTALLSADFIIVVAHFCF